MQGYSLLLQGPPVVEDFRFSRLPTLWNFALFRHHTYGDNSIFFSKYTPYQIDASLSDASELFRRKKKQS